MSKEPKLHLKLNNRPICGSKGKKIQYAPSQDQLTCKNCKRAVRS